MPGFPVTDGVETLLPPPEGYVVDFDNPERQNNIQVYWIAGFGNILAVLFLFQRLYTKFFLTRGIQLDDVFLVLSWLISVATQVVIVYSFTSGSNGAHAWEISIQKFDTFMLSVYIAAPIFLLATSFAKVSLLIFYLRLSPQTWFRFSVQVTLTLIALYTPAIFFSLIFACNPINRAWDIAVTDGECINQTGLFIATAVANIITDVILFVLPIPMVWGLKLPTAQKLGVIVVFAIGTMTVITSIIRTVILPEMFTNADQTWVCAPPSMWCLVESNLLVMCGAFPTLKKFCRHVAPRMLGDSTPESTSSDQVPGTPTLITYGNTRRKKHSKFDEGDEMYPISPKTRDDDDRVIGGTTTVDGGGSQMGSWDSRSRGGDDDSEKAIVQTTTFTLLYG